MRPIRPSNRFLPLECPYAVTDSANDGIPCGPLFGSALDWFHPIPDWPRAPPITRSSRSRQPRGVLGFLYFSCPLDVASRRHRHIWGQTSGLPTTTSFGSGSFGGGGHSVERSLLSFLHSSRLAPPCGPRFLPVLGFRNVVVALERPAPDVRRGAGSGLTMSPPIRTSA